ncbi:hypothetical protein X975_12151, partial [Stegodyphus mimosarum]
MLLNITYVDYCVMSYFNLQDHWDEYQVVLSFLVSNTMSLLLWYILYMRRKTMTKLLEDMSVTCDGFLVIQRKETRMINSAVFFCVICVPLAYSTTSIYLINYHDKSNDYYAFYTYGWKVQNLTLSINVYLFFKNLTTTLLDPVFISIITFVYCMMCCRCCELLGDCSRRTLKLLRSECLPSRRSLLNVMKEYSRIIQLLERFQSAFSLPSFLLTMVGSTSSFTILASALHYTPEEVTAPVIAENTFVFLTSAFSLIGVIACAAQVPIAMNTVKTYLQKLYEKILWCDDDIKFNESLILLLNQLKERPSVILSGCEVDQ